MAPMAIVEVSPPSTSSWPGWRSVPRIQRGVRATMATPMGIFTSSAQRQLAQVVSTPPTISPIEAPLMATAE